jgi:hypothetical protein
VPAAVVVVVAAAAAALVVEAVAVVAAAVVAAAVAAAAAISAAASAAGHPWQARRSKGRHWGVECPGLSCRGRMRGWGASLRSSMRFASGLPLIKAGRHRRLCGQTALVVSVVRLGLAM